MNTMKMVLSTVLMSVIAVALAKDIAIDKTEIQRAAEQAKTVINKVQTESINVEDVRRTPQIPDMQSQGANIHSEQSIDPMVIAKEMESKTSVQSHNVNMDSFKSGSLVVFVSMSMPEPSLKRIAREAAKVGGVLMLRGFVNDSLMQTVSATKELANLGVEIQINPDLFRAYEVNAVPTFVLAVNPESQAGCAGKTMCQNHIKLEGDASLTSVLEKMSLSNDKKMATLAESKLSVLRGELP